MARTYVGIEIGATYTFTGSDGTIATVNDSTLTATDVGWLTGVPTGLRRAPARTSTEPRTGAAGSIAYPFWLAEKAIQFQGKIREGNGVNAGVENQRLDRLYEAAGVGEDVTISWQPAQPDGSLGDSVQVTARYSTSQEADVRPKSWQLGFIAVDPLIYSSATSTASSTVTTTTPAGFHFPLAFPLAFALGSGASVNCENQGDAVAPVTITLTGPATRPGVQLVGGGQIILNGTLGVGETVTIDTAAYTAFGSSGSDWYSSIDSSSSTWSVTPFGLSPGTNQLVYAAAGGLAAGSSISVAWRSAWK